MKTSIVIPNWNGAEKLKKHLPIVLRIAKIEKVEEVIVSDDASTDNSIEVLEKKFPEVVLAKRSVNEGFSSNVNTGVNTASGDLVILLNTDAEPREGFLKEALPHFDNPKVFSVGSRVGDGLWAKASFHDGFFWHGQSELISGEKLVAHQTLWVSGGSGIFRKSIWDELGGLDTLFDPFYEEDVDLGYRATKRGYLNIWEPKSMVEHNQEKGVIESNFSKGTVAKTAQRNQLIFIWKNITSSKMISGHKNALIKMLLTHPKYWLVFLAALNKWPQIMEKRKIEQRAAKLTDEEVLQSVIN